jgi:hypothetical protein
MKQIGIGWNYESVDWADVLKFLQLQGVRKRGEMSNGATDILEYKNKLYMVCDNGGEINVELINHSQFRSVPITRYGRLLDPCTIGYRIFCALTDSEIDYSYDLSEYSAILQEVTV